MAFRKFFKIRFGFFLFAMALSLSAPAQDTTMASNTTATEAAMSAPDSAAAPVAEPKVDLNIDTTMLSWTGGGVALKDTPEKAAALKAFWYYFLLFVLVCVFIGIVGKAIRVYELAKGVAGRESKVNWNAIQGVLFAIMLVLGLYGAYWSYTVQGPMSVTETASEHGKLLDSMFMTTLIITTIVFVITHILLFGFSYMYAGSSKRKAYFYPHNNMVERIWTIVPAFVLAGLVLFGFLTWRKITNVSKEDQAKAISMEITGEQFKWNVRYAGADNALGLRNYKLTTPTNGLGIDFTDKKSWDDKFTADIVLPVNKPVRVTINSKDIIHSFYLPDFKAQINAVPGMTTYFQFTPTITTAEMRLRRKEPGYNYTLLCAKICGMGHYNMQAKVTVVTQAEYDAWVAKLPLYYNDDMKKEMAAKAKAETDVKRIALNR